ncbi:MAG: hypothetical protein IRY99_13695, partial [Isosphaeraceae bacterium]|nr:hypothetical protein [Isosphaeraceae bacterium]
PEFEEAEAEAKAPTRAALDESARVDQVWSRGAEWGSTLFVLAIVGVAVASLVYMTFSVDNLALPFTILLVGGTAWVLLSYPILITLERPIRITPEQAVKDFYAALSHHVPHFRRMWLLLSSAGRSSPHFHTFSEFKKYWKDRLAQIRGDRVKGMTPLSFQVENFKSEKSVGKNYVSAKFTVSAYVRGHQNEGPLESVRVETGLVKGPDNMWYLNQGTLPGRA